MMDRQEAVMVVGEGEVNLKPALVHSMETLRSLKHLVARVEEEVAATWQPAAVLFT